MNEELSQDSCKRLEIVAKILYVFTIIAMAAINCRFHSAWWLIGYGFALVGASGSLINYRLSDNQAGVLLLVGIIQFILSLAGIFVQGIWLPIVEILICSLMGGNLHNLWEEEEKKKQGEVLNTNRFSTESPSEASFSSVNEDAEEQILKNQIIYWATHRNYREAVEYVKANRRSKILASVLETLLAEGNDGNMESLYSVGFFGICNGIAKDSREEMEIGIRFVSFAAKNDYTYAMAFVAFLYHTVHYKNTGIQEKNMADVLLKIVQEQCDPEYCYRKASYML